MGMIFSFNTLQNCSLPRAFGRMNKMEPLDMAYLSSGLAFRGLVEWVETSSEAGKMHGHPIAL